MPHLSKPHRALCLAWIALSLVGCAGRQLQTKVDSTLHQLDSTGVVFGARILELPSGRELYASSADEPMIPASNMKLLATAAALDMWPTDHTFKTYFAMDGDDLWVIGTGDPGIGDPQINRKRGGSTTTVLSDWSAALKARGISHIGGRLLYYDGALEMQQIHPTWHRGDLVNWYAAPIGGLNFNDNCVDITVIPTEAGKPVRYEVVPPVTNIKIVNNCTTNGSGPASVERAQDSNTYTLSGGCNTRTALRSKPVTDPGAFFADALRTNLESNGITIAGPTQPAESPLGGKVVPPQEKIVAVHETKLSELLPRINKNSQNLLTEGLCKMLGAAYDRQRGIERPGSWESGAAAVRAFLQKHRIDDSKLVYADGSGLSNRNRVTARLISDILLTMHRHPQHKAFFDSLGIGGRDGTIENRFKDVPDRVHAKTGYISGTRALSGYVQTRQDRQLIFSIIFNKIRGPVRPYEHLQDETCRLLISYPKLDYRPAATQPATQPATTRSR